MELYVFPLMGSTGREIIYLIMIYTSFMYHKRDSLWETPTENFICGCHVGVLTGPAYSLKNSFIIP